nr:zinc finger, CCHC-type [Tanacetum cinerariifolium]
MFEKPPAVEIYDLVDALHSCRQAPGKPISEHVLEMKGLMDQLHTLGKPYDNDMAVNLINKSINKDFGDFRNCPLYLEELRANKKKSEPSAAVSVYHPQTHPTHYTQNFSTRSQQATTGNRGKEIINSPQPIYNQEPSMVVEDDETSKDKEIDKIMALISLSFKKIYKPTNNLRTSSNTNRANQDNSLRINRTRECQKPKRAKDAAYHREKMLLCKQEEARIQLNAEQADWKDDADDDELEDQELEAHYILSEINNLLYADYKKPEPELARRNSKEYASQMELECAKVRGDLLSYKMDYQKSCTKYTETINDLNQTISETKDKLFAHQEIISILSKQKEAQIKLYKTQEDKELEKVIDLENKVKVLDNIVYKTGQTVQTMNMLNNKCRTSFVKPEFLKKAQRANPRLYDIGCYNDNLALMLAPDSDEVIRLEKESRSKLSDLIRPFDYDKLNNLECQKPKRAKNAAYHREKMLMCKQEEARIQLNAEQADWKDDTDDESDDQELEAHYMYMAKVQEVSPDAVDSGPIFDTDPEQKVQNDDHYDVFAI